jgi:hypothetical protein
MAIGTTNHDEIRKWAESKGGKPAAVDRTHQGGDVGIIRIMFPNSPQSEHQSLVEISWDEFFDQFEDSKLALMYEKDSLFSKIVGRDTLERREHGEHASRHDSRGAPGGQHATHRSDSRNQQHSASQSHSGGKQQGGKQPGGSGGNQVGGSGADDLKSREYRDKDGNVHHHTRAYEEGHRGKK